MQWTEVRGAKQHSGRIATLETTKGPVDGDWVVNCCNAWARRSRMVQTAREATTRAATSRPRQLRRRQIARSSGASRRRSLSARTTVVLTGRSPLEAAMRIHVAPTSTPTLKGRRVRRVANPGFRLRGFLH